MTLDGSAMLAFGRRLRYDGAILKSLHREANSMPINPMPSATDQMIASTVRHRGPLFGENILQCLFADLFWPPPQCSQWFYENHVAPWLAAKELANE